jgi:hypothetical protein
MNTFLKICGLIVIVGCKSSGGQQKVMNAAPEGVITGTAESAYPFGESKKIVCPEGQQLLTAGVKRLENISASEAGFQGDIYIEKPGIKLNENVQEADLTSLNYNVRFDFCFDNGENFELRRIILQKKSEYSFGGLQPVFHELLVKDPAPVPAFAKAFFQQDYSGIEARFINQNGLSYFVKGHRLASGASFLTLSQYKADSDPFVAASDGNSGKPGMTLAELEEGNPYEALDAPVDANAGLEVATHALVKDHLDFKFVYEVRIREGGYKTYRYERRGLIKIVDSNPKLKSKITMTVEKEAAKAALKYTPSHHNLSDTFTFSDPSGQATYTLEPGSEDDGTLNVTYREDLGIAPLSFPIERKRSPVQ